MFCEVARTEGLRVLLRPLSQLFIQDADLYLEALCRVPEESRGRVRLLVRRALQMMSPMGYNTVINVRRTRTV